MKVGLYDDPVFLEHDAGAGHPERPQRLTALREGIRRSGLEPRVELLAPRDATREELLRVHTAEHIAAITRKRTARWVSASSTTSPSPPPTPWPAAGRASPSSTSTCTTATGRSTRSSRTGASSTSRRTPILSTRARERWPRRGGAKAAASP